MQYTILPASSLTGTDIVHLLGIGYIIAVAMVVWFIIGASKVSR